MERNRWPKRPLYPSAALWILAVIATAFFLRAASSLFIPITLASLVSSALLAVPMLVIVKAAADHVEGLKPVSRMMAP